MQLYIEYRTDYRFTRPQSRIIQLLRVTPNNHAGQTILDWAIDVDCDARLRSHIDGYGNKITMLYVPGPVEQLNIGVSGRVLTEDVAGIIRDTDEPLPPAVFLRSTWLSEPSPDMHEMAKNICRVEREILARLHLLNQELNRRLAFDPGKTTVDTDAATAFSAGHGVCQDFVHIFCGVARKMDIPARYISGHLFRHDGAEVQPAAHAWAEAYVDSLGWVGFDPTNGICVDDAYIRVATGLDYMEAAPLSGARMGGGDESMSVDVRVSMSQSQQQN